MMQYINKKLMYKSIVIITEVNKKMNIKINKLIVGLVVLLLLLNVSVVMAYTDSNGKGHEKNSDNKGHTKHGCGDDTDNDDSDNGNNGNNSDSDDSDDSGDGDSDDSDDSDNSDDSDDSDGTDVISSSNAQHTNRNSCQLTTPLFDNYEIGERIPALYTWILSGTNCEIITTEYYPEPWQHTGLVLCSPEHIKGELNTNFWNTPKGQRILEWKAQSNS